MLECQILSSFHEHNLLLKKNYLKPEKSTTPVIIIAEMLAEFWPRSSALKGRVGSHTCTYTTQLSLLCFLEVVQEIVAANLSQVTQVIFFFFTKNPIMSHKLRLIICQIFLPL